MRHNQIPQQFQEDIAKLKSDNLNSKVVEGKMLVLQSGGTYEELTTSNKLSQSFGSQTVSANINKVELKPLELDGTPVTTFDPTTDIIDVWLNGIRQVPGIDYDIVEVLSKFYIQRKIGDYTIADPAVYGDVADTISYSVLLNKKVLNGEDYAEGSLIKDASVNKSKLNLTLQAEISDATTAVLDIQNKLGKQGIFDMSVWASRVDGKHVTAFDVPAVGDVTDEVLDGATKVVTMTTEFDKPTAGQILETVTVGIDAYKRITTFVGDSVEVVYGVVYEEF